MIECPHGNLNFVGAAFDILFKITSGRKRDVAGTLNYFTIVQHTMQYCGNFQQRTVKKEQSSQIDSPRNDLKLMIFKYVFGDNNAV